MAVIAERETASSQTGLSAPKRALLEKWARGQAPNSSPAQGQGIPRRTQTGVIPLSFAQQGLWFFSQLEPSSPLYNIVVAVQLRGPLNSVALQKSLDAILTRHEALRTHFTLEDDGPIQRIDAPSAVPMKLIDLKGMPPAQRQTETSRLLSEEARQPFDIERDTLIRALLVQIEEREWAFLVVMHHIVSDLLSWRVLCKELAALYQGNVSGQDAQLPDLPIQYADFASWQRQSLSSDSLKEHVQYWRRQLAGSPPFLHFPADHARPEVQSFHGACEYLTLPGKLSEQLKALSASQGATLFMTLLAGFQALLHRYTATDDVLIGSPIGGRTRAELEPLVGHFVNTLVLRANFAEKPNFRELLRKVRTVVLEALEHQDLPFEKLVEELQPERSASYSPVIQVLFAHHTAPAHSFQLPGLSVTPLNVDSGTAKFDLTLFVLESDGSLTCQAEYDTALFEARTIRQFLADYQLLLERVVSNPDQRVSELSLSFAHHDSTKKIL